ncbi:putative Response regulator protein TmoT [Hyphomicrobiales bacterium]|nr:putative Response regulator protein TmoT [Hyphomicrobiales bacterium]CAH1699572.1 putative Response regulator protein TmoT [Hyphomicrobiales bacterium]CAI0344581.1 putative Response regulator protein TmoT [Hyphomicrobiales bacterium]
MSPLVHIVDHDEASHGGIESMLQANGYRTRVYIRPHDILHHHPSDTVASCVVIDTTAPDESIPDILGLFSKASLALPVIFLTDKADVRVGVRAMKAGAEDFFMKPFDPEEFIGAVDRAISRQRLFHEQIDWIRDNLARLEKLTKREREVLDLVVRGNINKQVAFTLGTTVRTIKAHRRKVMEKMQVHSIVELASCAERLGLMRSIV